MTGEQLRHYRESHGLSQRALARRLGDVSSSALGRWELAPDTPIPGWVAERLFRRFPITLPLEDLAVLLEEARSRDTTPEQLLIGLLQEHAQRLRNQEPTLPPPIPPRENYPGSGDTEPTGPF